MHIILKKSFAAINYNRHHWDSSELRKKIILTGEDNYKNDGYVNEEKLKVTQVTANLKCIINGSGLYKKSQHELIIFCFSQAHKDV